MLQSEQLRAGGTDWFDWPIGLEFDLGNLMSVTIALVSLFIAITSERKRHDRDEQQRRQDARAALQEQERLASLERLASAKTMYFSYLKTAFDNPRYSCAKYDKENEVEVDRYDSFVSMMLYACDELITRVKDQDAILQRLKEEAMADRIAAGQEVVDNDGAAIRHQVEVHSAYLVDIVHKELQGASWRGEYPNLLPIFDEVFDRLGLKPSSAALAKSRQGAPPE